MSRHEAQLIRKHTRRLEIIELRIAECGVSAPPEWISEADDVRVEIARLRIRRAARQSVVLRPAAQRLTTDRLVRALAACVIVLILIAGTTIVVR